MKQGSFEQQRMRFLILGLPAGPPSQLPRPTTTMSAPTTPSVPTITNIISSNSLPATPSEPTAISPPSSPVKEKPLIGQDQNRSPLNQGNGFTYVHMYIHTYLHT